MGTYAVNAATNQLTAYSYDGNGNQTTSNANGSSANLVYEVANPDGHVDQFAAWRILRI